MNQTRTTRRAQLSKALTALLLLLGQRGELFRCWLGKGWVVPSSDVIAMTIGVVLKGDGAAAGQKVFAD